MKKLSEAGYNERLFSGGLRSTLHMARFNWLKKSLKRLQCQYDSILELGCFDGKVLDFLPEAPTRYMGLDANWEDGLDIAKEKWKSHQQNYQFKQCQAPENMDLNGERFDISLVMETFEHIPPNLVSPYLKALSEATRGYIFITVPNEIGVVFFCKYLVKRLFGDTESYSMREFVNETLGRTDKVDREEHKGFNYNQLTSEVGEYFDVIELSGHPFGFFPAYLNFGVGIIGKQKTYGGI